MRNLWLAAKQKWDDEVDREAAALVEAGYEPFAALERARRTVKERRERAASNMSLLRGGEL